MKDNHMLYMIWLTNNNGPIYGLRSLLKKSVLSSSAKSISRVTIGHSMFVESVSVFLLVRESVFSPLVELE
jgi:hypothetical protein